MGKWDISSVIVVSYLLKKHKSRFNRQGKQRANKVTVNESSSDSEIEALMISHNMLSVSATRKWIVDSGASCHMCCDSGLFETLENLKHPIDVSVGDGHSLKATGRGIISLNMRLSFEKLTKCKLMDVLYVPKLSYNLLSVSKATEAGATTEFNEQGCQIYNGSNKLIAVAKKTGSLYYLNCLTCIEKVNVVDQKTKEMIWHRRFGHLGMQNLQKLVRSKLVRRFDFDASKKLDFCEAYVEGKHHRSYFPTSSSGRAKEPLAIVMYVEK